MNEQQRQERITEIYRLLCEADELGIAAPGLEAELEVLDPVEDEPLAEGEETPVQEYQRIRNLRDLKPTYSMLGKMETETE